MAFITQPNSFAGVGVVSLNDSIINLSSPKRLHHREKQQKPSIAANLFRRKEKKKKKKLEKQQEQVVSIDIGLLVKRGFKRSTRNALHVM